MTTLDKAFFSQALRAPGLALAFLNRPTFGATCPVLIVLCANERPIVWARPECEFDSRSTV